MLIMADSIQFSILGLDSLLGKLESVKYDVKKRGGRAALRKAAALVADQARQNALAVNDPATGRAIADNVALRWNGRVFKRSGDLAFRVGVLKGAVLPKDASEADKAANAPTPHWRLIEFGTSKMPAKPMLRPALADNINKATDTFVREYEKSIDRAIKRAAKKAS